MVKDKTDSIGRRLRQARSNLRFTQKELSEVSGISQGNISNFENGSREPETTSLVKLSTALNCSTDYLLGLSDVPQIAGANTPPLGMEVIPQNPDFLKFLGGIANAQASFGSHPMWKRWLKDRLTEVEGMNKYPESLDEALEDFAGDSGSKKSEQAG